MNKILIYNSGGGLGDSIQLFSLIISLKEHFKNSNFYYLSSHQNHFNGALREYKIKLKTLNLKIDYFGFRIWHYYLVNNFFKQTNIKKFDLIIDLQSKLRNSLILRKIPHNYFYSSALNYKLCTIIKKYNKKDHLKNLSLFLNTNIIEKKYNISNLNKKFFLEAKKLLPGNKYIGFSITQGNLHRKKTWPLENFIKLGKIFVKKNKIPVFFIEKDYNLIRSIKKEIPEALFPEQKSKLKCPALVTALASRLKLAISIDNGIMHMMGLSKIPMILLFGPTNSEKFAPNYKLVKVLDSKILYKSDDITKITVNDVLGLI